MHIEVDQSGRVEQTNTDTILALSNRIQRSIRLPAKVKREAIQILREQGVTPETYYLKIFCAGLFVLLKPVLRETQGILIDQEYIGKDQTIKLFLLQMAKKERVDFRKATITVGKIKDKSPAHDLAWSLRRKKGGENEKVSLERVLSLAT